MTKFDLQAHEHQIEGYERVIEFKEPRSGLHAIVAIHNTANGPALGGIRVHPYASFDEAMRDALRLAAGMTYKSGVAQTGTGGGKSVIIADTRKPRSKELLHAFGEAINTFGGQYIGAEDAGMPVSNLAVIREKTRYLVGLPHPCSSGNPSPYTAFGGYRGIQAVCQFLWGTDSVQGRTFAVQGLGSVGMLLAERIFWDGGKLIVTDIDDQRINEAVSRFGAKRSTPEKIHTEECDVFVPCALGAILNPETIPQLNCRAVAGLANNQLLTTEDGDALMKRGILYAPDYVINGGGLLNVCVEIEEDGYNPQLARDHITRIYDFLLEIFQAAKERGVSTHVEADEIAESNIAKGIGRRTKPIVFHH